MKRVVFDSDLLGDDLFALSALCRNPEVQLEAVMTFGRRTTALERCRVAQVYMEDKGTKGVPIVPGVSHPLTMESLKGCTFCDDAMNTIRARWEPGKEYANPIMEDRGAAEYLVKISKKQPGLSLLCTGPLTNIALALTIDRTLPERIGEVVLMGGLDCTTMSLQQVAEANIKNDPEAAEIVFASFKDIIVVSLNATMLFCIEDNDNGSMKDCFLKPVIGACCHAHVVKGQGAFMPLHDYLAYLALIDRHTVSLTRADIGIVLTGDRRAETDVVYSSQGRHLFATGIDKELCLRYFQNDFQGGFDD